MKLSISRSRESIWVWLFWGLGIYLVLELGPFFIIKHVLHKTVGELVGPYLAFAVPAIIVMPLIWWLRKWEERDGASPKRLARGWGLSMLLFFGALGIAFYYSGVELLLIGKSDPVASFILSVLWLGVIAYFTGYSRTLKRISARAPVKQGRPSPNSRPK